MSSQKTHENFFKFVLYQVVETETNEETGKVTHVTDMITERIFSADVVNQMARYSVNIKELLPSIIQRLQKLLSNKNLTYSEKHGDNVIDFLKEYQKCPILRQDKNGGWSTKLTQPPIRNVDILDVNGNVIKTITGVECKFCFYINDNMIVERLFYVDRYNPAVRFSTEIVETVRDITDDILTVIKRNDMNNIWDDLAIINAYGFSHINAVRELKKDQRDLYLRNINNPDFIKSVKWRFKKTNTAEDSVAVEE